jgi:hypothetical protein
MSLMVMTGVGVAFTLSFILPLLTGVGGVYGGLSLHKGSSPRLVRGTAIGTVIGHAVLILGSVPGLVLGGCTSALLILASPFLAILAVGAAIMTFMAVREGELLQTDATPKTLESP